MIQVLVELQSAMSEIVRLREDRDAALATVSRLSELLEDVTSREAGEDDTQYSSVDADRAPHERVSVATSNLMPASSSNAADVVLRVGQAAVVTEFAIDPDEWPRTTHFCAGHRARELEARAVDGSRGNVIVVWAQENNVADNNKPEKHDRQLVDAARESSDGNGVHIDAHPPSQAAESGNTASPRVDMVVLSGSASGHTHTDDGPSLADVTAPSSVVDVHLDNDGSTAAMDDGVESLHIALLARDGTAESSAEESERLVELMKMMTGQKKDDPQWEVSE